MMAIRMRPGHAPELIDIPNTLAALQEEVDGYIETYPHSRDSIILCNEEGLLMGLPKNVSINGNTFVGTILIVGTAGEEFADVPHAVIKQYGLDRLS